jgi:hypothetical protein
MQDKTNVKLGLEVVTPQTETQFILNKKRLVKCTPLNTLIQSLTMLAMHVL